MAVSVKNEGPTQDCLVRQQQRVTHQAADTILTQGASSMGIEHRIRSFRLESEQQSLPVRGCDIQQQCGRCHGADALVYSDLIQATDKSVALCLVSHVVVPMRADQCRMTRSVPSVHYCYLPPHRWPCADWTPDAVQGSDGMA